MNAAEWAKVTDFLLINKQLAGSPLTGKAAAGLYNPMQFVLRLSPDVHAQLKAVPAGIHHRDAVSRLQVEAFGTFLHETVHWWQHVGSNYGLITSLQYPVQAHIIYQDLRQLLATAGPIKPLVTYAFSRPAINKQTTQHLNRALNYWYDLETAGELARLPGRAPELSPNPFFLYAGHCYHMLWSAVLQTLAATVDPQFRFLPDVAQWGQHFEQLSTERAEGFYEGSRMTIPPLGTQAIYEGQAHFCQLQYLHNSLGDTMDDFEAAGLLSGIYIEAFTIFLQVMQEERPATAVHPLVGLFLLICDIALNPTDGFPFAITHYESFLVANDPGHRFLLLCQLLMHERPDLKISITQYDKAEYVSISRQLARLIGCHSPAESCAHVCEWVQREAALQQLLAEESACHYQEANQPIRLLFSKYLRLQQDKLASPEFFCWPGMYLVGRAGHELTLEAVELLFNRHRAFFSDDEHGDIYPLQMPGVSKEQLTATLDQFYTGTCLYDLVRQWVMAPGPFVFDYSWLSGKHTPAEMEAWATDIFTNSFGVSPRDFQLL